MNLKKFNGLFRDYSIAAAEFRRGHTPAKPMLDAELAVLMAARELAEGQLSAKLQDIETTIMGVRDEAEALYAEISEANGRLNDELEDTEGTFDNVSDVELPNRPQDSLRKALEGMLEAYAPGAQASADRHGEQSLHSAVRDARRALREVVVHRVTGEDILAAVDTEEELPGDMPDSVWTMLRMMNRAEMTEFLRESVRETKAGIRGRIKDLLYGANGGAAKAHAGSANADIRGARRDQTLPQNESQR